MAFSEAQKQYPDIQLGDYIEEALEPIDFGRIGAQTAKQVILQRIRDAEREAAAERFSRPRGKSSSTAGDQARRARQRDHRGRARRGRCFRATRLIPKENLRVGDRVRAFVMRIDRNVRGPQPGALAHRARIHHGAVPSRSP